VIAYEIQEHLILPEYPDTDKGGVLHIIHASKNPLQNIEDTTTHVNQITSQLMSSVCLVYFYHMSNISLAYVKLIIVGSIFDQAPQIGQENLHETPPERL
jgi:hypothetical protein